MKIKKYLNNGGTIFNNSGAVSYVSGFYGSVPEWLNTQLLNMVSMVIEDDFSTRELMQDNTTVDNDLIADINGRNARLLVRNKQKYDHLYKLFNLDYNPIWNVDGTETTTRALTNSNSSTSTGTSELTRNTTDTTEVSDTLTFDTTVTNNNEVVTDGTTTNDLTENSNDNKSRTTFDSNNFYDTDKDVFNKTNTGTVDNDETVTTEATEGKTGTESRSIENELKHTGKDTTENNNTIQNEGNESETITHVRSGNIGTTMTQDMALKEVDYANYIKFIDIIALDVVRNFSIGC